MDDYAKEGLRTLLIAQKVMTQDEFKSWILKQTTA